MRAVEPSAPTVAGPCCTGVVNRLPVRVFATSACAPGCRRALMEAWIGRETASFRLPPSRLALDPVDVIRLAHDGRSLDFRLLSAADAEARGIEAIRQDRAAYDLPPGDPRPALRARPLVLAAPEVAFFNLPQLTEDQPAHRPFLAAHARP